MCHNVLGAVSGGIIVIGAIGIFALHDLFLDPVLDALSVTTSGVVFKTIAEQIGQGDFTTYGILFLYGLAMIPLLSYLIAGRQGKPSLYAIILIGIEMLVLYLVTEILVLDLVIKIILLCIFLVMIPLLSYLIAGRQGKPLLHTLIPIEIAMLIHYLLIVVMGSSSLSWLGSTNSWLIFILFVFFDIIAIFLLTLKFSPEGGK
ncbi:MAG: hypothetical protein CVT89_04335, partial [Candidatus Altiarchaeales archaeon HGW-Altiarchaeales-2]